MHPAQIALPTVPHKFDVFGHAYRGQPMLAAFAVLMLLALVPTALALGFDVRTLNGINVWIKPLKFEFSLAVQLLTVAWLLLCLPPERRDTRLIRVLSALMVAAAAFEIAYIILQASRGEASHFNESTPTARLLYMLMGVGAIILVVTSGWIGVLILRRGQTADPLVFAAGLGLVLGSVLGGLAGAYLSSRTGHWVGGQPTDVGGLPVFGWSRSGGDLRVAHFVGLHLMQVLPITTWIATHTLPTRLRKPLVIMVAAMGIFATVAVFAQALRGLPLVASG